MRVLIIGATGMLGRPVARRLLADGLEVRAMVRDVARARKALPSGCEFVRGDLRDAAVLDMAFRGMDAVYLNLAAPMKSRAPKYEPELHGTQAAIDAARRAGVKRMLRISAMGVDEAAASWWAADHKARADRALIDRGLVWTIFRPTWLTESLATMVFGRVLMLFDIAAPLRWLAGDDLARQVSASVQSSLAVNTITYPQGPELVTMRDAGKRFAVAWGGLRVLRFPLWPLEFGAMVNGRAAYLHRLLRMTVEHFTRIDQQEIPTMLPAATMTIEDYVTYMRESGDRPRK
jgi:uncharacterized protein YbjT (DUF2867 family)